MKEDIIPIQDEIVLYQSEDGNVKVDVLFQDETVWLTQSQLCMLFGKSKATISEHIKHIFEEGELDDKVVVRKFRHTTQHGAIEGLSQTKEVKYYNLDVIISVGYRVNSYEATQFRIWAREVLKEYIIEGYVMDDDRLKGKNPFGADYFEGLLDRIREIRLSESRYYQKITDIYAECSSDYDPKSEVTKTFYKTVQNMMHHAPWPAPPQQMAGTQQACVKPQQEKFPTSMLSPCQSIALGVPKLSFKHLKA